MTCFVLMIFGYIAWGSMSQPDAVVKNSYEKSKSYNEVMAARANAKQLVTQVKLKQDGATLLLTLPQPATGKVVFERPSDKRLDRSYSLKGKTTKLPLAQLRPGLYNMKVSWKYRGKAYLHEQNYHAP